MSKAISDVAGAISKTDKFESVKQEIIKLCAGRNIDVQDINIKQNKNGKYLINVYKKICKSEDDCRTYEIQNILSDVLDASIVLKDNVCPIKGKKDICKMVYTSKDKFNIQIAVATEKKTGVTVSGDSNVEEMLDDGKYLVAISDGMGSGQEARKASKTAVNMLSRMLSSGFDKDTSLELINSSMYINSKDDSYATLDVAIFDLYSGNMEFMKNGACPTFIKNGRKVDVVKSVSLPAGILDQVDLVVYDKDLNDGDIIIMCSDGVLESNLEYENKEMWVKNLLEEIEGNNVQKIADILLAQAIDNGAGRNEDDMTVVVCKVKSENIV